MKKVSKIKLQDAEVMTDSEMKYIFGGTGFNEGATGCAKIVDPSKCADTKCSIDFMEMDQETNKEVVVNKPSNCEWESTVSKCHCVFRAPTGAIPLA